MPESNLWESIRIASILFGLIAIVIGFFAKFQTKVSCVKSHATHDKLEKQKQKLRDEQRNNMHESIQRIEATLTRMSEDFYRPVIEKNKENGG